jgi:uncharacterized membrane protein YfcA
MEDVVTWALLCVSALIVGASKAGFGSGAGILAIPLMASVIGASNMLGTLLPILILGDIFSVVHYLKRFDRRDLAFLLCGCVPGVFAGMFLLEWFRSRPQGEQGLGAIVGLVCVFFVTTKFVGLIKKWRAAADVKPEGAEPARDPASIWLALPVGILAGFTSTLAHAAGPVIAMYLIKRSHDRGFFVGTTAWFFLGCNLLKLGPFIYSGVVNADTLYYLPRLAPVVILGTVLGAWLNKRVTANVFNLIVYVLVSATGIKLVLRFLGTL